MRVLRRRMTWLALLACGLWACEEGGEVSPLSLEKVLISPVEMLEYESLSTRQALWEALLGQAREQALNPSYIQPLFPLSSPSGFVAKEGPAEPLLCLRETEMAPKEAPSELEAKEAFAEMAPKEEAELKEEPSELAPKEEFVELSLKLDERRESWSDVPREAWGGLSERDVARCLALSLLTQWQVKGEVNLQRVTRSPYAAAYVEGSLRLNPAFVSLAAAAF